MQIYITATLYDDEHEEYRGERMTIADCLDRFTDEGCPTESKPKQGEWIMSDYQKEEDTDNGNYLYTCSVCGHSDVQAKTQEVPYCWWCGSMMMKGGTE